LPGSLPGMHWPELLPQKFTNIGGPWTGGVLVNTKYSLWLQELKRYGYAE